MMAMYSEIELRSNAKKSVMEQNVPEKTTATNIQSFVPDPGASDENEDPNANLTGKPLVAHFAGVKKQTVSISPDTYVCELCGERPVDINIAKDIQSRLNKTNLITESESVNVEESSVKSDPTVDNKDTTNTLIVDRALQLGLFDSGDVACLAGSNESQGKRNSKKASHTNVNLRIPSPPRASKRKQDLTTSSYIDSRRKSKVKELQMVSADDSSPLVTPVKTMNSIGSVNSDAKPEPVKRSRCLKRKNQSQVAFDPNHNPLGTAWTKNYREADHNVYTKTLANQVSNRALCNVEKNHSVPPSCFSRNPLCRVVLFDHNDKGVEGSISLSINEVVIEVRGKMMLLEEYEHFCDPLSDYNRFAMIYRGFSDRVIVIDSSSYGNDARFIRRSCVPNCKLDHFIINNKLHIVIRTICEISPGTELTIPFDIDYRALHYPVVCACCRSRCPVYKWSKKLMRNKVVPKMDYGKYIESQLKVLSTPLGKDGSPIAWSGQSQFDSPSSNSVISLISPRSTPNTTPMSTPAKTNLMHLHSPGLPISPLAPALQYDLPIQSTVRKRLFTQPESSIDDISPAAKKMVVEADGETNLIDNLPNKRRRKKKQVLDL